VLLAQEGKDGMFKLSWFLKLFVELYAQGTSRLPEQDFKINQLHPSPEPSSLFLITKRFSKVIPDRGDQYGIEPLHDTIRRISYLRHSPETTFVDFLAILFVITIDMMGMEPLDNYGGIMTYFGWNL
jgi:hypothetical protein